MAMHQCAVIVLLSGRCGGLLNSLESIANQDTSTPLEIILAVETGADTEQECLQILDQSPWIANYCIVRTSGQELFTKALDTSTAEYFLTITVGDVLFPNAVQLLTDAVVAGGKGIGFGVTRWTNGRASWSHDSVNELFRAKTLREIDRDELPEVLTQSAIGMFHRTLLATENYEHLSLAVLVHEYLCERSSVEGAGVRCVYRIPTSHKHRKQDVYMATFPHASKVVPKRPGCVWLFGERGGEAAEDNGLALFQYCVEKASDIECYYVLNQGVSCSGLLGYESNILYKNTEVWEVKVNQASHFFFTDSAADILVASNDINRFPDVTNVYLTHGCLAYSPGVYQKFHQYIDFVTCTNQRDIESASREWGFPSSKFLLTGLARWDRLKNRPGKRKEVLLCPTWRKHFDLSHWNKDEDILEEDLEILRNSDFFVYFTSFLQSPELLLILERDDIFVTVSLHFRFRKYLPLFDELHSERIRISTPDNDARNLREMMEDAVALITDYSSIMWDMGFMEKPVICYQFDKPGMLAERDKDQFAITDDQLFAKVCYSQDSLIRALSELVSRDFRNDNLQEITLNRYIPRRDTHNCERIYKAITTLGESVDRGKAPDEAGSILSHDPNERTQSILQSLSSVTRVGVIADLDLSSYTNVIELRPDTWKELLNTEALDVIVVEPHLNARNCWAPIFFEPEATRTLLNELVDLCEARNIRTVFCQSPTFICNADLHALSGCFSEVLPAGRAALDTCQFDVSVIIPVYNSESYLLKTINSVLCQQFIGTIEVIIVNDGSTDGTQKVIDQHIAEHSNIVGIKQSNARQGMARNHALLVARGEYVMFLDSDDVLPVNAVAELHHALKFNETKVATGLVVSCDSAGDGQRINQAYYHYSKAPKMVTAESWPHVFYDPSCAGKMYQREFLLDSKLFFPQSFHEDQVFAFKLFSSSERIAVTKSVVYLYVARSEPGVQSGTQTFTNEKFREMLLAGTLARAIVKQSGLPSSIVEYALGFLVMRYDRFLWKQSSLGNREVDDALYDETMALLERFLSEISDEVIWRNARHCAVFLLLIKRSMHDLAAKLRFDDSGTVLSGMISEQVLPGDIQIALQSASELVSRYNYYRAVPIGSLSTNSHVITEMSYGYRLGQIFVDVAKSPGKVLLLPLRMVVLLYDMATGKGRVKERVKREEFLKSSPQALLNHSAFIQSTASYRLGVAIMEVFTGSPKAIFKLPGKVKQIYEQNV